MNRQELTKRYTAWIAACPGMELKGKANPYTSANGHMFSQINKDDELGIRFSTETQKQYFETYQTGPFKSYGAVMRGYILIPETLLYEDAIMIRLLQEAESFVKSLEPK